MTSLTAWPRDVTIVCVVVISGQTLTWWRQKLQCDVLFLTEVKIICLIMILSHKNNYWDPGMLYCLTHLKLTICSASFINVLLYTNTKGFTIFAFWPLNPVSYSNFSDLVLNLFWWFISHDIYYNFSENGLITNFIVGGLI